MTPPDPGFLSGYKTYILSGMGILAAWVAFALGEETNGVAAMPFAETLENTITLLIAITLRAAITTKQTPGETPTILAPVVSEQNDSVPIYYTVASPQTRVPPDLAAKMQDMMKAANVKRTFLFSILCLSPLFLVGCLQPRGYIDAEALTPALPLLLDRHDKLVTENSTMHPFEKEAYLRSSQGIRLVLKQGLDSAQRRQEPVFPPTTQPAE
jgi:hypothetical protein